MTSRQVRGNALFIVLIAIALFAALSYSVTRSSRTVVGMAQEDAFFAAQGIFRFSSDVRDAVDRVMNSGAGFDTLRFNFPTPTGTNEVFARDGGGVQYTEPDAQWLDQRHAAQVLFGNWYFPRNVCVPFVGTGDETCEGTAGSMDVIIMLPYIHPDVCTFINTRLNVCGGAACADANVIWNAGAPAYNGTFAAGEEISDAGASYNGVTEGCIAGAGTAPDQPTDSFHYFKVLAER